MSDTKELVNFEERMAALAKQTMETESGGGGNFLSLKSGVLSYDGNPCQNNELDVVIIHTIFENHMYTQPYDPDNPAPPDCYAFGEEEDTMVPHPDAPDPQSPNCKDCQWNQWDSRKDGKKGKECKNVRRLGLIPGTVKTPEDVTAAEIIYLKIPVTSVKNFKNYVRTVSAMTKLPPLASVSKIKVIPDVKTQFKVTFILIEQLDKSLHGALLSKADEVRALIDFPYAKPDNKEAAESDSKKF